MIEAKKNLNAEGIDAGIVLLERIKPYTPAVSFIKRISSSDTHIVYVEEGIKNGGAGMITKSAVLGGDLNFRFDIAAIDDNFANPMQICDIYDYVGLSSEKIAEYFKH